MTEDKLVRLVRKIEEKTRDGALKWEKTASEDEFQTTLANFVIVIRRNYDDHSASNDYYIKLVNLTGEELEVISDIDLRKMGATIGELINGYELMDRIFRMAKRQASGIEQAIDDVISELDKLPPF